MSGIPAQRRFGGVPFTIRAPHDLGQAEREDVFRADGRDRESAPPASQQSPVEEEEEAEEAEEEGGGGEKRRQKHEALLVLALPRCLLERLPGHEDDDGLFVLPAEVLRAMRPSTFSGVFDQGLWLKGVVCLPPTCVLRVYTLVGSEALGAATTVAISRAVAANNKAQRVGSIKGLRRKSAATLRSLAPQWIFEGDDYFEMGHHLASVDDVETVTSTIDLARSMVRSCATKVHHTATRTTRTTRTRRTRKSVA